MKQKLSSRKFWVGLAVVIVGVVLCCIGDIKNGMVLINVGALSYLGAEGLVDIFRIVFSCGLFNENETQLQDDTAGDATEGNTDDVDQIRG